MKLSLSKKQILQLLENKDYSKAQEIKPHLQNKASQAFAYYYLAQCAGVQGQYNNALSYVIQAINLDHTQSLFYDNLGNLFTIVGKMQEGLAFCQGLCEKLEQDKKLKPEIKADIFLKLALAFSAFNWHFKTHALFKEALTCQPDFIPAQCGLALTELVLGNIQTGFQQLNACYGLPQLPQTHAKESLWQSGSLQDKTILLHSDQGFGDAIMFARFIPYVIPMAKKVVLEIPRALVNLLSTMKLPIKIVTPEENFQEFDVHCPLMLLPRLLNLNLATIPAPIPYLLPKQDKNLLLPPARFGTVLKVGIAWAGNPTHANDINRSSSLNTFEPLLTLDKVQFYSLQMGQASWQQTQLKEKEKLISLAPLIVDFTDTAQLLTQLDLVITIDTALVHLCGAIGIPTWLLLPFSPEWRWMLQSSDTPWYPTVRLFRQAQPRDWPELIARVKQALCLLLAR